MLVTPSSQFTPHLRPSQLLYAPQSIACSARDEQGNSTALPSEPTIQFKPASPPSLSSELKRAASKKLGSDIPAEFGTSFASSAEREFLQAKESASKELNQLKRTLGSTDAAIKAILSSDFEIPPSPPRDNTFFQPSVLAITTIYLTQVRGSEFAKCQAEMAYRHEAMIPGAALTKSTSRHALTRYARRRASWA